MQQKAPSSAAKHVLTALACVAHHESGLAWPSVPYLSEITQQDRKTVLKSLCSLEATGLITAHGKAGKTGQITVWRLEFLSSAPLAQLDQAPQNSPKNGTLPTDQTVPNFPSNSTKFPAKQYQKRDTEEKKKEEGTKESARADCVANSTRGSRLPEDWHPTPADIEFCRQRRPDLNPAEVAENFRDHWIAQPGAKGRKTNWAATWRNWVKRERQRAGSAPAHSVGSSWWESAA
jgi:hypothetical protein